MEGNLEPNREVKEISEKIYKSNPEAIKESKSEKDFNVNENIPIKENNAITKDEKKLKMAQPLKLFLIKKKNSL